jgi:predicted XRE-type DNA-binding protein
MIKDTEFVDGSENVFADIGVRDPEESRLRADLALQIVRLIRKRGLRQTEVAEMLGVDQAKVSKLVRGRISGFTSDRLLRFLRALGCKVRIEVREPRSLRRRVRGKVEVVAV